MLTDAHRLLTVVGQLTTRDFARVFRDGLSPAELMQVITALPTGRLNGLMDRARRAATQPSSQQTQPWERQQDRPMAKAIRTARKQAACHRWSWPPRWASASPA
jgi:hypothetical protein